MAAGSRRADFSPFTRGWPFTSQERASRGLDVALRDRHQHWHNSWFGPAAGFRTRGTLVCRASAPPSGRERAANLSRQGFRSYAPRVRRTIRHARKLRNVLVPLFPGYIFVILNLSTDRWRSVNGTIGVASLIMGAEQPMPNCRRHARLVPSIFLRRARRARRRGPFSAPA